MHETYMSQHAAPTQHIGSPHALNRLSNKNEKKIIGIPRQRAQRSSVARRAWNALHTCRVTVYLLYKPAHTGTHLYGVADLEHESCNCTHNKRCRIRTIIQAYSPCWQQVTSLLCGSSSPGIFGTKPQHACRAFAQFNEQFTCSACVACMTHEGFTPRMLL